MSRLIDFTAFSNPKPFIKPALYDYVINITLLLLLYYQYYYYQAPRAERGFHGHAVVASHTTVNILRSTIYVDKAFHFTWCAACIVQFTCCAVDDHHGLPHASPSSSSCTNFWQIHPRGRVEPSSVMYVCALLCMILWHTAYTGWTLQSSLILDVGLKDVRSARFHSPAGAAL